MIFRFLVPRHSILASILIAFGKHLASRKTAESVEPSLISEVLTALKRSLFLGLDRECVLKLICFRNLRFSVIFGSQFSILVRPIVVTNKKSKKQSCGEPRRIPGHELWAP